MSSCREQNRSFIYIFFLNLKQNKNKHLKYILLNNATSLYIREVFFPHQQQQQQQHNRKKEESTKNKNVHTKSFYARPGTLELRRRLITGTGQIDQLICFSHNHIRNHKTTTSRSTWNLFNSTVPSIQSVINSFVSSFVNSILKQVHM